MSGGWGQSAGLTRTDDFGALTGISATPSNTINTKGAWISVGTLTADCSAFLLKINYTNNGQADFGAQVDIGIGGVGSQVVLVPTINLTNTSFFTADIFQHLIPLALPAGTQLWCRSAVRIASFTGSIKCWITPFADTFLSDGAFTGIDAIGSTGVGSGTVITPGSNLTGTKGSYATLNTTAGTARDYAGFFLAFDLAHNVVNESGNVLDIAIGASGSQKIIVPDLFIYIGGVEAPNDLEYLPIPLAAGTQLWCRSAATNAGNFGVTLYGVF